LRLEQAKGPSTAARTDNWKVATWEIAQLGSCHLIKYPWKVAAWERAFEKYLSS